MFQFQKYNEYTHCPPVSHNALTAWRVALRVVGKRPKRIFEDKLNEPREVEVPPHGTLIIDKRWAAEFDDGSLLYLLDDDLKTESETVRWLSQAVALIKSCGMHISWDDNIPSVPGYLYNETNLRFNPETATAYTALHGFGRMLVTPMCCVEHLEFAAHGAALALMHTLNIAPTNEDRQRIIHYSGCDSCPANKEKKR